MTKLKSKKEKLARLTRIKIQLRDIWAMHGWNGSGFTQEEKKTVADLGNEVESIESTGVFNKCSSCGKEKRGVDYGEGSIDNMVCQDCWEESGKRTLIH